MRTAADASHRLESMAEAYVSFAHEHPTEFALMFSPRGRAGGGSARSRAYSALEGAVADLTATGAIREEPRAAPLIWSAVHGLATLSLDGAVGTSLDAIRADARRLSRALVRGLAPEA